jgi:haloalkane dehalogenase
MSTDISAQPFAAKKYETVNGYRMAYIDEGEGDPIIFQHGNPTSSYLWRNVMPHLRGLGRLIACDLIGMGDSDKLTPSGPDRYSYAEQREFLFALWDTLDLGNRVILVVHDWGSVLGFDWANRNRARVQGIAYMESIPRPLTMADFPPEAATTMPNIHSLEGERMMLEHNMFVEQLLPSQIIRTLSDEEMAAYRKPFVSPGEDRRPTLSWPRQLPIDGRPPEPVAAATSYAAWLPQSAVPKLFVNAEPGTMITGEMRKFCRTWPNQTEVTVKGRHFIQEDSPAEIGTALAAFVRGLRGRDSRATNSAE